MGDEYSGDEFEAKARDVMRAPGKIDAAAAAQRATPLSPARRAAARPAAASSSPGTTTTPSKTERLPSITPEGRGSRNKAKTAGAGAEEGADRRDRGARPHTASTSSPSRTLTTSTSTSSSSPSSTTAPGGEGVLRRSGSSGGSSGGGGGAINKGELVALYRKANAELQEQIRTNINFERVTTLENRIKVVNDDVVELQGELATLKRIHATQTKAVKDAEGGGGGGGGSAQEASEIADLKERLAVCNERRASKQEQVRKLTEELHKLERSARADSRRRDKAPSAKDVEARDKAIGELEKKNQIAENAKEAERRRFENDIAEAKKQYARLQSEIAAAEADVKMRKDELEDMTGGDSQAGTVVQV